jgi:polyhydroxybutyrate depolymerase
MWNATAFMLLLAPVVGQLEPGAHTQTVEVGSLTRSYVVHIPPCYDGSKPLPVVLIFHGGGSNAEQMVRFCGLNEKADKAGFIAVYPSGTGLFPKMLTWNGGNCCGYAMRNNIDDVAFVRTLLDDLTNVAKIDPKRIYATGMSNGGIISYYLASNLSDRIAAIAPVGGPMGTADCNPKRPVPVMHFHGTNDEFAAFNGGPGPKSVGQTNFYSVEHSIQAWVKANGCPSEPKIEKMPDKADDGMTVTKKTYGPGNGGSEVILFVIEGGGHTWPGREPHKQRLGESTRDISANDLMWEFFQKHARNVEESSAPEPAIRDEDTLR